MDDNVFINPPQAQNSPWKIATIATVVTGGATVKFGGEDTATSKVYKCNTNYTPAANDRVLMAWFSGSGVILCKF